MTPYMAAIREAAKEAAELSRIERLFGMFDKEAPAPRVHVPKPKPPTRTPAQQRQWDGLIAAWRAEPNAKLAAIRQRFGCSLSTAYYAKVAASNPLRQRKTPSPSTPKEKP